jgi:phosphoglycerol transferase MdoB-like AlkP superfamily enzyme
MQPEYESLHLTDGMKALGERGIWVKAFLPASHGTMKSFGAVVTGLPYAGVYVNYQPGLRGGLVTSAATIFERLGYRSRFFYTGYLSWQRIGDFCREQGFDEVVGGDQMAEQLTGNEWGVDDATLFDYILENTGDEPTFNVVLTTSYHPPFSVDVEGEGFDLARLRGNPLCEGLTDERLKVLGHLWYSDKSLTNFVFGAESRLGESLFAITGDHYSRRALASRPTLYERTSVPLVLYGPALERVARPPVTAGSHLDMMPTLVELVAPTGFAYASFGRNILDPSDLSPVGLGCEAVIGPDFILSVADAASMQGLSGAKLNEEQYSEVLVRRYRQLHGLSWWRSMKGNDFPALP